MPRAPVQLKSTAGRIVFTHSEAFLKLDNNLEAVGDSIDLTSDADLSAIMQSLESGPSTENIKLSSSADLTGGSACIVDADDDVINWSAKCGMKSAYSATVALTNQRGKITEATRLSRMKIRLDSTASQAAFGGAVTWINGIIKSIDFPHEIAKTHVTLTVGAYGSNLSIKPINTQRYEDTAVCTVLNDVFFTYGALLAGFFECNLTSGLNYDGILVTGSNLLEEAKKLCQAASGTLYTNREGVIVAEDWKDETNPVALAIPDNAVLNAKEVSKKFDGPSIIRVRGRYRGERENGKVRLMTQQMVRTSGIDLSRFQTTMRVPIGTRDQIRQADVFILPTNDYRDDLKVTVLDVAEDGSEMTIELEPIDPAAATDFFSKSQEQTLEIAIEGFRDLEREIASIGGNTQGIQEAMGRFQKLQDFMLNFPLDPVTGSRGSFRPISNKTTDEDESFRVGAYIVDEDLLAEFGVRTEEINNNYIVSDAQCEVVALRRFKEYKMARDSWAVKLVYLPAVELNQVVTFSPPESPERTITGLVTAIGVSYDPSPKTMMDITVESFQSL